MRNLDNSVDFSAIRILLLCLLLLSALTLPVSAQTRKDAANIAELRQKATSEGYVRVIVHFVVPGIEELSAASAKFWGVDSTADVTRSRLQADANLSKAIEDASWKLMAELHGTDYEETARFQYVPLIALRVSPFALAVLEASPDVLGIEENIPMKLIEPVQGADVDRDRENSKNKESTYRPMLTDTAGLIGAKTAWNWGYTGTGWYVAVLDTGIRSSHQFFSGKNIIEACRAIGRDGYTTSGDCPNGLAVQNGPGSAAHYASIYDGYDHGTHVAGIAAGDYGSMSGIAKRANIIAVQVFSKFTAADCGDSPCVLSWPSDQLAGLEYVYSLRGSYNIASVNMSIGGGIYTSACDYNSRKPIIDLLRAAGIATVIAAGNDYYCYAVSSPACISTSVAVGSSTKSDGESMFTNWHPIMQKLFAPGSSIRSSTGGSNASYEFWYGTSMAAPHVAGVWAILKQAIPGAGVTQLLNALRDTGIGVTSVCDAHATPIPRIRIDRALDSLLNRTLTVKSGANGTTQPAPGTYAHRLGTQTQVRGIPNTHYEFANWSGDASGTDNPITITMDGDKTIEANFRPMPKLTLQASQYGTTDPSPGVYYYATGTQIQIWPIPDTYSVFTNWSGNATGSAEPLLITMDSDKIVTAHFRFIYAPHASGQKVLNRTFSQAEYINILSWEANSANFGLNIIKYKIYLLVNGIPSLLAEAGANQNQYYHRNAGQEYRDYTIVAVHSSGREGEPAYVKIQ